MRVNRRCKIKEESKKKFNAKVGSGKLLHNFKKVEIYGATSNDDG